MAVVDGEEVRLLEREKVAVSLELPVSEDVVLREPEGVAEKDTLSLADLVSDLVLLGVLLAELEDEVVWLSEAERVGLRDSDSVAEKEPEGDDVPLLVCEIVELPEELSEGVAVGLALDV
jgi:hypothetical protein